MYSIWQFYTFDSSGGADKANGHKIKLVVNANSNKNNNTENENAYG